MSYKDYVNLKIVEGFLPLNDEKRDSSFFNDLSFAKKSEKERQIQKSNQEIEKVLFKNKERLKTEKLRIIEKLRC